jgi:hypothetical protein
MTTPRVEKIALVSHFSEVGDWAFDAALQMARARETAINIYYFLESPFEISHDVAPADIEVPAYDEQTLVAKEREVREYFEDRLGDFVQVGFRVCPTGRHNLELRRCLLRREYQLLIIPYLSPDVGFGNMSLQEFAYRFAAPVMLVGPERPSEYRFNPFAGVVHGSDHLVYGPWQAINAPTELQTLPVV